MEKNLGNQSGNRIFDYRRENPCKNSEDCYFFPRRDGRCREGRMKVCELHLIKIENELENYSKIEADKLFQKSSLSK